MKRLLVECMKKKKRRKEITRESGRRLQVYKARKINPSTSKPGQLSSPHGRPLKKQAQVRMKRPLQLPHVKPRFKKGIQTCQNTLQQVGIAWKSCFLARCRYGFQQSAPSHQKVPDAQLNHHYLVSFTCQIK